MYLSAFMALLAVAAWVDAPKAAYPALGAALGFALAALFGRD